ncbi:MAG: hypothetical protein ACREUT_09005 [Steroidobacteraceae bacterium]
MPAAGADARRKETRARCIAASSLDSGPPGTTVRAARRLNRATGLLATSVLLDSGIEHYRGSFKNGFMFAPPVVSALTLAVSAHGTADSRPLAHRARQAVFSAAAITGLAGTGFHLYNVCKRPGRLAWQNLFYGAPLGAPMAILLAGLLGAAAEEVRHTAAGRSARVLGLPAGRLLAAVSGVGILGTVAEAALLHFRGAYHNPAMYAPITVPPVSAALLLGAAASASPRRGRIARAWLRVTALLGFAGVGFHIFGVARNMGGWRNWTQNVLNGPPLPAPPSFTGLALAGLAALRLLQDRAHD